MQDDNALDKLSAEEWDKVNNPKMRNVEVVAIIPARGNSKGLPRKNLRELYGKPLINWTIEAALGSKYIGATFVSTEDQEIADVAFKTGANVLSRPDALSMDNSQMPEVCCFVLRQIITNVGLNPTLVVILTPTTPLRTAQHIDEAIEQFVYADKRGARSLISGYKSDRYFWHVSDPNAKLYQPVGHNPANRQGRQESSDDFLFAESGSIYIVRTERYLQTRDFRIEPYTFYEMPEFNSLDIDEEKDLHQAHYRLREMYPDDENEWLDSIYVSE